MALPPTIAQFFPDTSAARDWVVTNFDLTAAFGLSIYAVMVYSFTLFYSHVNINSEQTAENFQKSSTFIVGIKPGKQTEKYISKTVTALAIIGGFILTLIAITPYLLSYAGIDQSIAVGGTSMIIMVAVALDTWEQLKSRVIASTTKVNQKKKIKGFGEIKELKEEEGENSETVLFD